MLYKYTIYTTTGRRVKVSCERELNETELIAFLKVHNPQYVMSTYFDSNESFDMTLAKQVEIPEPMSDTYKAAYKRQFGCDWND